MGITIKNNELYITGNFANASITFENLTPLTSYGDIDIYVAKMNPANGNWLWAKKAGGTGCDLPYFEIINCGSNICVSGRISGTASFGSISVTSNGSQDGFLAKISPSGVWQSAENIGGTGDDTVSGVSSNGSNIFVSGTFQNTMTIGNTPFTCLGNGDGFVAKRSLD